LRYDKNPSASIHSYRECLASFSELGDLRGIAYSSYDLSRVYLKSGDLDKAWYYCLRSLNVAISLESIPLQLHSLHGFAEYFAETGQPERALNLCYLIIDHPLVEPNTWQRATVTKSILETFLSREAIWSVRSKVVFGDYKEIIDQLLCEKTVLPHNIVP
jgi:hypothetical protein